jgi:rubrerythrin
MYPFPYPMNRINLYQNYNKFLQDLLKAVSREAQAIDFYTRVLQYAVTEKYKRDFQHALEDEKKHYQLFTGLYHSLTGKKAIVPPFQPIQFKKYTDVVDKRIEAVDKALDHELEAYEMYRDMYLSTTDPLARDIMLRGFTDEGKHAMRFTYQRLLL